MGGDGRDRVGGENLNGDMWMGETGLGCSCVCDGYKERFEYVIIQYV